MAPQRAHAALLGLIQGPAELLPVSSSGHVEAARLLFGWEGDEVALHTGSLAALVLGCRSEILPILRRLTARRIGMHLLAGGIPATIGYARERKQGLSPHSRPRDSGDSPLVLGLVAGAALLLAADVDPPPLETVAVFHRSVGRTAYVGRPRWDAGPVDGVWLGLAQAAALWPGVSRNGATLAVARLRGFNRSEANLLSREVGVPVTLGAVALRRGGVNAGTLTAFASALATLPALRAVDRGGRLWPFALERIGLALVLLRQSRS